MKKTATIILLVLSKIVFAQTIYIDSTSYANNEHIEKHDNTFYENNSIACNYTDKNGKSMPYRLFLPPGYDAHKKYPLLLSFHGAGSRGNDNKKQLRPWLAGWMDEQVQAQHPCIIVIPQCPSKQQWVNVAWKEGSYVLKNIPISEPMKLAKEIFDKVIKENAVDKNRIYVMGCSMGGYATWNFVMRYPRLITAAVPICGAGDPSMAKEIKHLPIWAFHGDKDPTVPLSGSTDMIKALTSFKDNKAQLTIYEGVGHNSYEMAWKETDLVDWVFSQKKK
jgi:predicted peptidase